MLNPLNYYLKCILCGADKFKPKFIWNKNLNRIKLATIGVWDLFWLFLDFKTYELGGVLLPLHLEIDSFCWH